MSCAIDSVKTTRRGGTLWIMSLGEPPSFKPARNVRQEGSDRTVNFALWTAVETCNAWEVRRPCAASRQLPCRERATCLQWDRGRERGRAVWSSLVRVRTIGEEAEIVWFTPVCKVADGRPTVKDVAIKQSPLSMHYAQRPLNCPGPGRGFGGTRGATGPAQVQGTPAGGGTPEPTRRCIIEPHNDT